MGFFITLFTIFGLGLYFAWLQRNDNYINFKEVTLRVDDTLIEISELLYCIWFYIFLIYLA